MNSAAPKTYISKRMLERYTQERIKQQQTTTTAPVVPSKQFAEDSISLAPIQEENKELEQTNQDLVQAAQAQAQPVAVDQNQAQAVPEKKGIISSIMGLFSSSATGNKESEPADLGKRKRRNSMDRNLSCDEMDSDDLDGDLNLSDDENGAATRNQIKKKSAPEARQDRETYAIEFDTNVFKVALDCLENKTALVAGDAEFCADCQGVFNNSSTLVEEEGKQIWVCEFCNKRNEVMIGEEEIPQQEEVTYIIEAAAQVEQAEEEQKTESEKPQKSDSVSVVFCIDISGSMRGSRLNAAKNAIISQINSMAEKNADRKVGIIAFDNVVDVIGDGVEKIHTIDDKEGALVNFDMLKRIGEGLGDTHLKNNISQTKDSLLEKTNQLQTRGTTALGPAVLASLAMASKGCPGSQVIVLTDGMANVGLGSFNRGQNEANEFYDKVGQLAEEKGVMINLVTFAGTEANIMGLSRMVELSGGQVEQVNEHELANDFAQMLAAKAIATKVEAKVKIHKGLQFRNELEKDLTMDKTILTRRFGNVTKESMFTFEYGMKPISQLLAMQDFDMATMTHFPFQTQIHYTALDGSKCLRVITKKLEISNEREELAKVADADLVQQNCLMQGSKQARAGNTRKAQAIMKNFNRKTKEMGDDRWISNRADFQAQTSEAYGAMNMQAMSMKMPQQQMQMDAQPRMQKKKMQNRAPARMQQNMQMNAMPMQMDVQMLSNSFQPQQQMMMQAPVMQQQSAAPMGDRFASQMFQMSKNAKRSKY